MGNMGNNIPRVQPYRNVEDKETVIRTPKIYDEKNIKPAGRLQ
jgi:hypothetical protein